MITVSELNTPVCLIVRNTGTGCPEKLWLPPPWQCSRTGWMGLGAVWCSGGCPCWWQGGWNQMIFKVPSNPYRSVFLWFLLPVLSPKGAGMGDFCARLTGIMANLVNLFLDSEIRIRVSFCACFKAHLSQSVGIRWKLGNWTALWLVDCFSFSFSSCFLSAKLSDFVF